MRKFMNKLAAMMLISCLVLTALPVTSQAATYGVMNVESEKIYTYDPNPSEFNNYNIHYIHIENMPTDAVVTKVKSSNKKVIAIDNSYKMPGYIVTKAKKAGKATISFTVTTGGSIYKIQTKVKIYNYESPFSKIKINNKSVKSEFQNKQYMYLKYKKGKTYKFSFKGTGSWVYSGGAVYSKDDTWVKNLISGGTFMPESNNDSAFLYYYNMKTGAYQTIFFRFK